MAYNGSSSDSESSLNPDQLEMYRSTEGDTSSDLELDDLYQSLLRRPSKKRCQCGSNSAKGRLHPSNSLDINSRIAKPHAAGKENHPVTPTNEQLSFKGNHVLFQKSLPSSI